MFSLFLICSFPRHPSNLTSRNSSNENADEIDSAEAIMASLLASLNVASHNSVLGTASLPESTQKKSQNSAFSSNKLCRNHCYYCHHIYGLGYGMDMLDYIIQ
ncbi:unnamed protein product [Amaranthus hypochondriacus]